MHRALLTFQLTQRMDLNGLQSISEDGLRTLSAQEHPGSIFLNNHGSVRGPPPVQDAHQIILTGFIKGLEVKAQRMQCSRQTSIVGICWVRVCSVQCSLHYGSPIVKNLVATKVVKTDFDKFVLYTLYAFVVIVFFSFFFLNRFWSSQIKLQFNKIADVLQQLYILYLFYQIKFLAWVLVFVLSYQKCCTIKESIQANSKVCSQKHDTSLKMIGENACKDFWRWFGFFQIFGGWGVAKMTH